MQIAPNVVLTDDEILYRMKQEYAQFQEEESHFLRELGLKEEVEEPLPEVDWGHIWGQGREGGHRTFYMGRCVKGQFPGVLCGFCKCTRQWRTIWNPNFESVFVFYIYLNFDYKDNQQAVRTNLVIIMYYAEKCWIEPL